MRRPRMSTLQRECDDWNNAYSPGTRVAVERIDKSIIETETRSYAYIYRGDTSVIFVAGIAGCYSLKKVTAI